MVDFPGGLHGAYTRAELRHTLSAHELRAAVKSGRLIMFARNVLLDATRATEFRARAAASLLFAGPQAALCGASALALHGCGSAATAPVHVLIPYFRNLDRRAGLAVHRGRIDRQDIIELAGLRTQPLDVALADVLCREDRRAAIACADEALASVPAPERAEFRAWTVERVATRSDSRGRQRGLDLLDIATGLAESPMESWLLLAIADGGLPRPAAQVVVNGLDGREIYRLDLAWEDLRIGLEYDGYAAHEYRRTGDAARDEDLRRRGWLIIRVEIDDLKQPSRLLAEIRSAFRQRGIAA